MSDNAFEKSFIALSLAMATLIVLGLALWILKGLSPWPAVLLALVAEIVGGVLLLYFWGKSYMARR